VLRDADLVALVGSGDLAVSDAFYQGVLGLEAVESSSFATVYRVHGTELRVTHVDTVVAAPYTVLGWRVPDIKQAVESLAARGVEFARYNGLEQDAAGIWTSASGARVAWFHDPDGNTLSVSQSAP
jgi:catechol 2,3-dioxygenase-like lactoylglutathione lyase family enzyme